MLRINSRDVLVVPPFECAWLSLSDYGTEGGCCLCFDYKGAQRRAEWDAVTARSRRFLCACIVGAAAGAGLAQCASALGMHRTCHHKRSNAMSDGCRMRRRGSGCAITAAPAPQP
jgi:hypothetical protein